MDMRGNIALGWKKGGGFLVCDGGFLYFCVCVPEGLCPKGGRHGGGDGAVEILMVKN